MCREICIGGLGVARGYLHVERGGERFVEWSSKWTAIFGTNAEGPFVYRTGDVARRDSRGWLALCGRLDSMVKVRRPMGGAMKRLRIVTGFWHGATENGP